jgi:putative ABC transport system permease protein
MAWKSLTSQWLRSSLTTFGVFMGVSAVTATLNIQTITQAQIDQKLGLRDKPFVVPGFWGENLEPDLAKDAQALQQAIPQIRAISTVTEVYTRSVRFNGEKLDNIETLSVSLNYLETTGRRMVDGRFFNQADMDQYRPVIIIDQKLADALFDQDNPINQVIYVAGSRLLIIGVTETRSNYEYENQGTLWMTENFSQVLQNRWSWQQIQISPHHLEDIKILETEVEQVLRQRYPQIESVYMYSNAEDLLKEQETQRIASRALTGVGIVALVIGGVGIANITVAAVMERTKEIGIRRAIGASQGEIMAQFILEAVCLSLLGGVMAVATVHGLTGVVTTVVVDLPYQFSSRNAALAMGAAVTVGVLSSFFPALRATQVDIVKALKEN